MRKLKSLQWVPIMMCATQLNPNQPNHCFTALPVRAREHQIRAPKKCILGGLSRRPYSDRVTVYPYNGYIKSTNPIVWHVMSLTCTLERMLAYQHVPKHAATQTLHDSNSNTRARRKRYCRLIPGTKHEYSTYIPTQPIQISMHTKQQCIWQSWMHHVMASS